MAYKKSRDFSDHNHIIIDSQFSTLSQSRSFKFELSWLEHPDFLPKVEEIWLAPTRDNSALSRVLFKLKKVRKILKGWGYNLSGSRKKRKEIQETLQKLEEMEESSPLQDDMIRCRMQVKLELFTILDEEELYWFKRCNETWLLKGDNNTEFFHRIANGNRRKQSIFSLQDGDEVISGTEKLLDHASKYYKSLFGPGGGNAFEMGGGVIYGLKWIE
jgi:hypothetical protein